MTFKAGSGSTARTSRVAKYSRGIAIGAGAFFVLAGIMAMASPRSFFDSFATFEPYNQHFVQDIGAFQIGLGAVLLLAAFSQRADALSAALIGVGIGSAAHVVSHVGGHDLGGKPATDIPMFIIVSILLLAAGIARLRAD